MQARRERELREIDDNKSIVEVLQRFLLANNKTIGALLAEFESAKELMETYMKQQEVIPEVAITLKSAEGVNAKEHKGVYNLPTAKAQVGGMVDLDPSVSANLRVTIRSPKVDTKYDTVILSHTNYFYDIFQYPLLIPHGGKGYTHNLKRQKKVNALSSAKIDVPKDGKRLSPCANLYMERKDVFNYLTKRRMLFQQFVVDNYVKVESHRLCFIVDNQASIRRERCDILKADVASAKERGQRIIISPTFVGGPRYMKERQQDALAFVTHYGSPDFFITFTMNPKWKELRAAVVEMKGNPNTGCCDRPDMVSWVFKLKVEALIDDFTKNHIVGRVKAFLYSIEWQKRGLPHVHILLWMEYKVTAEFVDEIICAEIPDKEKEPRLYDCMIHGPCIGSDETNVCCKERLKKNGVCGKNFPKPSRNDILFGNNGYSQYRRRAPGEGDFTFERKIKEKTITVDNSWVVPYNPYLCLKYNAHINVECSNSIKSIAYVTKYVNKGCDKILYTKHKEGEPVNEMRNYLEARYINANEATWKIFKFPIHRSFPPITSLDLHLENENEIYYRETDLEHKISEQANQDTQLTVFFKLCKTNDFTKTLYYPEVPSHFVYDKDKHKWHESMTKTSSLERMRAVDTKTVELFYLRMLLTHK
ncbi:uncharacterized protein LOC143028827 [Oratosquilla oratoria]|uniref:uncharacterized protein LOC143028827 n=1 Tax=Oratosquilla oratoria TaxID=337810 RepID=UPI003F75ADE5